MESEASAWTRFSQRGFLLGFSHPDPTPGGQAVVRDERPFMKYPRVHLSSIDPRELYFEVVRFHDLTPEDEYRLHKPHLERRFGADSISSLTESTRWAWPAQTYWFGWTEDGRAVERSVLLRLIAGETYRIIFDPRSDLNAQLIETLTTAE